MLIILWLLLGLLAGYGYIHYTKRLSAPRSFDAFATALVVAAIIYVGFGLLWGSAQWILIELAGVLIYGVFALLGKKISHLWLAFGWLIHPAWDVFLHLTGPGHAIVPEWYAISCISFDVLMAIYIAIWFKNRTVSVLPGATLNTT